MESRESCDMIRQPNEDACLDGPPGSYFFDTAKDGQRRLWFVLPNGHTGVINIRPVTADNAGQPSWEWRRCERDPHAVSSQRRDVAWLVHPWPHGELLMDAVLDRVAEQAIKMDRLPLALIATCALCGERTESFSLHRMDPAPRHAKGCVLFGFAPITKGNDNG